jgi:hypothetical protein
MYEKVRRIIYDVCVNTECNVTSIPCLYRLLSTTHEYEEQC